MPFDQEDRIKTQGVYAKSLLFRSRCVGSISALLFQYFRRSFPTR